MRYENISSATAIYPSTSYPSSSFRARGPQFKRVNNHNLSSSQCSQPHDGQQSHPNHISERVETTINDVQLFVQAKVLRDVIYD